MYNSPHSPQYSTEFIHSINLPQYSQPSPRYSQLDDIMINPRIRRRNENLDDNELNTRTKKRRKLQSDVNKVKINSNEVVDIIDILEDNQKILKDYLKKFMSVNNPDLVIGGKYNEELESAVSDLKKGTDKLKLLFGKEVDHFKKFIDNEECCHICDSLIDKNTKFRANCNCKYNVCYKCAVIIINTERKYVCPSCGGAQFNGEL